MILTNRKIPGRTSQRKMKMINALLSGWARFRANKLLYASIVFFGVIVVICLWFILFG